MKNYLVLLLLFPWSTGIAQTLDEWFRPKQTQERYLLTQNSALRILGEQLDKGFELFAVGSEIISGIRAGELSTHQGFLARFKDAWKLSETLFSTQEQAAALIRLSRSIQQLHSMTRRENIPPELQQTLDIRLEELLRRIDHHQLMLLGWSVHLVDKEELRLQQADQLELEIRQSQRIINGLRYLLETYPSSLKTINQ